MDHKIIINNKCIACKKCVKDCLQSNIFINDKNKAEVRSQKCLKCGHCSAICPTNAVIITGYTEEPYEIDESLKKLNPNDLLNSIIFRRSIRQFKDAKVEKIKLDMIIEAGRWSPTAKNNQGVCYVVLDKEKDHLEKIAVKEFRKLMKVGKLFNKKYKNFAVDDNFFFKNAPIAIVIMADNDIDGALAASNMALMAESLNLGVLYSGFFAYATKLSKAIRKELDFPGKKVVTTLVIGYPDVEYQRSAQRDEAKVIYK